MFARLLSLVAFGVFPLALGAQPLPGVDPNVGPVAGRVYVDVERLERARLPEFESIDDLLNSKTVQHPNVGVHLQSAPLSEVIQLYFSEVVRAPYVICSEVLSDQRFVSMRASGKALDRAMMLALLSTNGLELRMISGVATVCAKPPELSEEQQAARRGTIYTYRPRNRSVAELVRVAKPLVIGVFANGNNDPSASSLGGDSRPSSYADGVAEVLVFSGEPKQIERLKQIIEATDVPTTSVMVRAALYELSSSETKASALKVLADLFNGKVGVSIYPGSSALSSSLSLSTSHFDFVASMISEDSRFRVLTQPFVRVQNGRSARFRVGQDVPVAGEILFNPNGQARQSMRYASSGVILDVAAHVRGEVIGLDLVQTVSNFSRTTVSNSDNPTLNKRELSSSLTLKDGEIVVLGGLSDVQRDSASQGLFGWNFAKSRVEREGQLVLVLQAEKI